MELNFKLQVKLFGRNERIAQFTSCLVGGCFVNLRELILEHVDNSVLREISLLTVSSNIRHFNVEANSIGVEGAGLISNSFWLSNLEELIMNGCNIGDEGLKEIFNSDFLIKLKHLNVRYNKIGDSGFEFIVNSKKLTHLTMLNMGKNKFDGKSMQNSQFPPNNPLTNLKALILDSNTLSDDFATNLLTECKFTQLEELNLQETNIGNECIQNGLSISPHFQTLKYLNISYNRLDDIAVQSIVNSEYLNNLQNLNCCGLLKIERTLRNELISKYRKVEVTASDDFRCGF